MFIVHVPSIACTFIVCFFMFPSYIARNGSDESLHLNKICFQMLKSFTVERIWAKICVRNVVQVTLTPMLYRQLTRRNTGVSRKRVTMSRVPWVCTA